MQIKPNIPGALDKNRNPATANLKKMLHPETAKAAHDTTSDDRAELAQQNPRRLLNEQILLALQNAVGGDTEFAELDEEQFAPENVADRILSFVGNALSSLGGDTEAAHARLRAARQGVERGFNEAKDILSNLGIYQNDIEANAEQTYELIQRGLDQFHQRITTGESLFQSAEVSDPEPAVINENHQRISLKITTQDGDMVTLHVMQRQHSEQINDAMQTTQHGASIKFEYATEGQLDEQELAAIDKLVNQVHQASERFFTNDTQAAIGIARNMGFDTSELASFSLRMKDVSYHRATRAYQQIGNSDDLAKQQLAKPGSPFGQFVRDFAQALGDMQRSPLFAVNANDSFEKLFIDLFRANDQQQSLAEQLQQRSGKLLEEITTGLINSLQPHINSHQNAG
ncbi:MAG: DUF5610 domain-containing protein [Gammaproteobacteria bacterium]|nr:DUF5610 domain-containing protein [Gammaproteobacteria bacterium]